MDVLIIIDMQEALLQGDAKHDISSVLERINRLAERVRRRGGCVIFIQHDGAPGDDFAPFTPGWAVMGSIRKDPSDRIVHKTLNDAFFGTSLKDDLTQIGAQRVLVAGWATDFCVDATVRSGAALGFKLVVVSDCHTVSDRPHLSAEQIIAHHHWVWTNLLAPHPVTIAREADI